jgi:NHL repeat
MARLKSWLFGLLRCVAAGLLVLVGPLALAAPPAGALVRFGSFGHGAGQFFEPHGIAVEHRSGEVYVLDTDNHRIERFSPGGRFQVAWGWGVADGRTRAPQACSARCHEGLAGDGPGQLSFAQGLTIDQDPHSRSFGDLYLADIWNYRVEKFSPRGRFLLMFGAQVNESARRRHERAGEDRCPVRPGDRCRKGVKEGGRGHFEFAVEGNFVAVGPHGDVYVGDRNRVEVFSENGVFRREVALSPAPRSSGGELGGVSGLLVDSAGDLYVIRNGVSGVREYAPDGRALRSFDDKGEPAWPEGPAPAMELDGAGHLLIDAFDGRHHAMLEYSLGGRLLARFDEGQEDALHGLAYGPGAGKLYLINTSSTLSSTAASVRVLDPPSPIALLAGMLAVSLGEW